VVAAAISLRDMVEQQGTETTCSRLHATLQQAEQVGDLVAVLGGHAKFQPVQKLEEAPLYFSLGEQMVDSVLSAVTGVLQVWYRGTGTVPGSGTVSWLYNRNISVVVINADLMDD
jgi:hypothetical protein